MTKANVKKHSTKNSISNASVYAVLIIISIVWLLPFVYLIFQAFRGESRSMVNYVLPKEWSLSNFEILFTETKFLNWYLNTFIIALFTACIQTVFVQTCLYRWI